MVKLAVLFTAGLTALTGFVAADNCRQNLNYCGTGLLNKGNYYVDIVNALQQGGQKTGSDNVSSSLFFCGSGGAITFLEYCTHGCQDGGSKNSDFGS